MNLDEEIHLPNYSKKTELKKTEMQMNPSVKGEKKSIWVLQRFSSKIEKFTIISYSFTVSKSSHKKALPPSIFFLVFVK